MYKISNVSWVTQKVIVKKYKINVKGCIKYVHNEYTKRKKCTFF